MTLLLLLLLMTGAPATPCGCKEANDIKTFWGHDNVVVVDRISCDIISGDIHDLNGKLLQDALVEVYKLERLKFGREWDYPTERVAACMTGENGKFCFDNLPPGLYEVRFSKEDYKTLSYEGINIRAKGKKKNKEACLHPVLWGS